MKRRLIGTFALLAGGAAMLRSSTRARPEPEPGPAGWGEFVESLADLPQRMLAKLPEPMRDAPQIQQEAARLALEALAAQAIEAIGGDGDHPQFLPVIGQLLNTGQPNADTIYRSATLAPGGTYRLRGLRGSLRMARIAEAGPRPPQVPGQPANLGAMRTVHDLNTLPVDAGGRYDVILSPERPDGYEGAWWQSSPTTNRLLLRLVSSDWAGEISPTFSIERLDVPAPRPRPSAAELERRLRALPAAVDFSALMFVDHVEQLRAQGYVNTLKVFDVSQMGGLQGQFYYEGAYDLADDEALIVSAKAPARCLYRSLILTNELYETTDWVNNHASLNDAQAPLDADGVLRIVVSARDPGVPNWLDTAGYSKGVIQGRWTDCDSQPIPEVQKVKVADVRQFLPPETPVVTPGQREAIIRTRRMALQLRPLW